MLQFDAIETLIVLCPEPLDPATGGCYVDGATRDQACEKLFAAYRHAGFEPWGNGRVWWLPLD